MEHGRKKCIYNGKSWYASTRHCLNRLDFSTKYRFLMMHLTAVLHRSRCKTAHSLKAIVSKKLVCMKVRIRNVNYIVKMKRFFTWRFYTELNNCWQNLILFCKNQLTLHFSDVFAAVKLDHLTVAIICTKLAK